MQLWCYTPKGLNVNSPGWSEAEPREKNRISYSRPRSNFHQNQNFGIGRKCWNIERSKKQIF
jgi:hypothetical protein